MPRQLAGADMRAWDKEIEALTPRLYERRRGFYTAINAIEQVQRDDDDNSAGSDRSCSR